MQSLEHVTGAPDVSSPGASPSNRLRRGLDPAAPESDAATNSLAVDVERAIRCLTRGGIADLEIQVSEDGIRLRGRCATFYCKQLAQEAAMKSARSTRLSNEIEVW